MNKDVIYIDVDDDITAIIGKVKASKAKIVALVPPKRVGALQSAVNLRLIERAAKNDKKHLVLITSNKALMALAASAKLPVAKNAQSKPEIPEIAALEIDEGEDIINGSELPIGEHARMASGASEESETDKAAAPIIAAGAAANKTPAKSAVTKKGPKVPNFNTFRKKLLIFGSLGLLLIGFLVWAIFFAPRATVVITAKTSDANISKTVRLETSDTAETSFSAGTLRAIQQVKKESKSVEFEATGEKDAGEKATGTVRLSTNDASFLAGGGNIPAGTQLTSSTGLVFVTDASVTLSLFTRSGTTTVTAAENGTKYNAATGSLSGAPSGVSADFTAPTGGGVTKMVTIVTASDVQKAAQQLADETEQSMKSDLQGMFGGDVVVIDESYSAKKGDPKSSPAVGEEATSAKLTTEITYSMYGVTKSELDTYLDAAVKESISDQPHQKVYDNGVNDIQLTDFATNEDASRVSIAATGKVGPNIDDTEVKEQVTGRQFGDIQADIEARQGVSEVDVQFFPFWVRTVPNNIDKITIEFKVDGQS